jgi:succinate-semialdehyde dehydrogenase/glutarate-semialdehyde dehydrogenase
MPSASLEEAVRTAVEARILNNGQSCIAAKRFIIHEEISDEFERKLVKAFRDLVVGDPMDPDTELGPPASAELLDRLDAQVKASLSQGAKLLTGGFRLDRQGSYFAPTVLADAPRASPAYREELFGPVASLFRVRDAAHAVRIANDTEFGLGASVWTHDAKEQQFLSREIEAGSVFVNQKVASDPRLPFGGVRKSGYGRELGRHGIHEFVNIKTISIRSGEARRPASGQPNSGDLE